MKTAIIFSIAAVLIGLGFGTSCSSEPEPVTTTTPPVVRPQPAIQWVAPTAPPGPKDQFGDGRYEVGTDPTDIKPGKYKTEGEPGPNKCYWGRLKALDGLVTSTIAIGYDGHGPQVVVIPATDKGFETVDCGVWRFMP